MAEYGTRENPALVDLQGGEDLEWAAALYESYAADHEWLNATKGDRWSESMYATTAERACTNIEYERLGY